MARQTTFRNLSMQRYYIIECVRYDFYNQNKMYLKMQGQGGLNIGEGWGFWEINFILVIDIYLIQLRFEYNLIN